MLRCTEFDWKASMANRYLRKAIQQCSIAALLFLGAVQVHAEPANKTARVGILFTGFEDNYAGAEREFLDGMRDLGYEEGKNLQVERRYAHLQPERMAALARELAGLNLNAIVTGCSGSTRAVQKATNTTPIVMASVSDPVGQGFVRSISQSGNNVTGRSSQSRELLPKMLELFMSAVPDAKRIAILINTKNKSHEVLWSDAVALTKPSGVTLVRVEAPGVPKLEAALAELDHNGAQGLLVLPDDPMFLNKRKQIVAKTRARRLPSFFGYREFVDDGGLMSYGEKFADSYRQTAVYIDKLVGGAAPTQLPVEQPTQFEFVINLKTASALGMTVPKALLLRANDTIR